MEDNRDTLSDAGLVSKQKFVSDGEIFKGWVVFVVLSTVCGFCAGVIVGGVLGGFLGAAGATLRTIQISYTIAGFFVSLPISYAFFRRSIRKLLAIG